jgi:hypothetical protein
MRPGVRALGAALAVALACVATRADAPNALADVTASVGTPPAPWRVLGLPKQTKPMTRFRVIPFEGQRVLEIEAELSYGNLVHDMPAAGGEARQLSWRWRVERNNPAGDPHKRSGDDHVIAVCAMFDLPLASLSFVERQMLRAARAASGEDLPSATLCYIWDERQPQGTVLESPFTRRVRYMVLRGSGEPLQQWRREERDLRADFVRSFGDETQAVPPLLAIAVSGDADNTQGRSLALLADLALR